MQIEFDSATGWTAREKIPFRGQRNYVHGTDLAGAFHGLVSQTVQQEVARIRMRFPRYTRTNGCFRLQFDELAPSQAEQSSVKALVELSDGSRLLGWFEEDGYLPLERRNNHEQSILDATSIDEDTAIYSGSMDPPPFEIIVFATKKLMYANFPDVKGKWVFTAFSSGFLPADLGDELDVAIEARLSTRAVVSAVRSRGQEIGEIYFGVAPE